MAEKILSSHHFRLFAMNKSSSRLSVVFLCTTVILLCYGYEDCDLGASDVVFVVRASHQMDTEVFNDVKDFIRRFTRKLDIGRGDQVG